MNQTVQQESELEHYKIRFEEKLNKRYKPSKVYKLSFNINSPMEKTNGIF